MVQQISIFSIIFWFWVQQQQLCLGDHILVTGLGGSASYGHWNQLLHLSKELLKRNQNHFITFFIDESRQHYLNTIQNDNTINSSSYQVIFTPNEVSCPGCRPCSAEAADMKPQSHIKLLQQWWCIQSYMINGALLSVEEIKTFLLQANTQFNDTCDKESKRLMKKKVDVCLVDAFHYSSHYLCHLFDIPIISVNIPAVLDSIESLTFWNSALFFNHNTMRDRKYLSSGLVNGSVMSYLQRLQNGIENLALVFFLHLSGHYHINPMIIRINKDLQNVPGINSDNALNYVYSIIPIRNLAVTISSLGPPFSTIFFKRQKIKQFGFLLYPSDYSNDLKNKNLQLYEWINDLDTPILYISMGSVYILEEYLLQHLYNILLKHSQENNYRILWAMRQNISSNKTNEELQMNHFRITKWVPQLEVLQNDKVKAFVTHAGINSILESLYSNVTMILFPGFADQIFNAKRIEELEAGFIIKDRETFSDLTGYINILLLNETSEAFYKNNLELLHNMLAQGGGVEEAVDFIEFASKYDIKHLLCTLGHKYDCHNTSIPWYQNTIIDVYFIIFIIIATIFLSVLSCINKYKYFK